MLAKRIIPCLDVHNGRVVKGINFVNLRDAGDPVEQAKVYDAEGADELIFLDITASKSQMLNQIHRLQSQLFPRGILPRLGNLCREEALRVPLPTL